MIEERLGVPLELSPLLPRRTSLGNLRNINIVQEIITNVKPERMIGKLKEISGTDQKVKEICDDDDDDAITVFKTENFNELFTSDDDEEHYQFDGDAN